MELNDKVKIIAEGNEFFGYTGKVSSILNNQEGKNIGVDIDWDNGDPKPYYFDDKDLEIVNEKTHEDNF